MFKNDDNKQKIIDGQQRLTTLMLILRAFYSYFGNMQDENSKKTAEAIGKCIWKTDEFGSSNKNKLKIDSEVSTDDNKDQKFIPVDTVLEIEHIFSRKRQDNEKSLKDKNSLESLGNKAILEKSINIRASDYRFEDKKKYYMGYVTDS